MTAIFSLPPIFTPPQSMTESAGWKRRLGGNTGHVVDPGVGKDVALVDLGGIAHEAEDIVVLAGDEGDVEALLFEAVNDFLELFLRGPLFGGDDHKIFPFYPSFPRPLCSAFQQKRVDLLHH